MEIVEQWIIISNNHVPDFDERTTDDWDVDYNGYYEEGGGDMDCEDFIKLRKDKRRREGIIEEDELFGGIGQFEKHTRGIGRKVLEKQGWSEGQSLGASQDGITDALGNDGQSSRDKRGFG